MLFRGERKGEQPRATERAGVSGKEARGGADNERQLAASRARRRPIAATRWPCSTTGRPRLGAARRSSGRDQKPNSAISKLPNS